MKTLVKEKDQLHILTEYDIYLFRQGTHYNIYDKMGANPMNVDGVDGVFFAVWAPNAHAVSVIGHFNNWDGRVNPMSNVYFSGVWEVFIPGLKDYDMYKFEVKTSEGHLLIKSDPYAKFSELRPGKASFVYDIDDYKWGDAEYQKKNKDPLHGPISIYECHLGSWKKRTEDVEDIKEEDRFLSFRELADDLIPYVKDMGYTHIELMPIQEHPLDMSWGYQVTGYYSVTARFGNPHEFMYFVDKCHQNGIGVILDWVPAHFPKDDNGLAFFDGTALYEHEDVRKGEHLEWGTKVFNYGRNEVKNFLIANAIYWVEKFHIDGLRVDAVSSMLYLDYNRSQGNWIPNKYGGRENEEAIEFVKHLNSILRDRYPHILMCAEESTSYPRVSHPLEWDGLGFNLKWNMGWMNDYLDYIEKEPIHRSYHHNNLTFAMMYNHTENFILVLSHDEVVHGKKALVDKMPGDMWQMFANLRLTYGWMFGHPGKKLVFMGGEFAHFAEWSEARSLDWHLLDYPLHATMKDFVKDLNHVYTENNALWSGDFDGNTFKWISVDDAAQSVLAFARYSTLDESMVVVVANFTPNTYEHFRIGVPKKGTYTELINSDASIYSGSGVTNTAPIKSEAIESHGFENSIDLRVPPLGVSILKFKK